MKILIITPAFYPHYSGAGRQMHTLAKEYVRRGNTVNVFTFSKSEAPSKEIIDGIEIVRAKSQYNFNSDSGK